MHLRSQVWLAAAFTLTLNLRKQAQAQHTEVSRTSGCLPATLRGLQAVDADTCLDLQTVTATVNSTLQLQAQQQLQNQSLSSGLLSGLSQYLKVTQCNLWLSYNSSTDCPIPGATNSTETCLGGNYICRGIAQVPLNVYSAVQENECTPDATGSTVNCLGTSLDLTTYLSVQQGQCCIQCPGQSDCTAGSAIGSPQAVIVPYQCGSFSLGIAVSEILDGSSEEDLLGTAVSGGLLDLYLQSAGLTDVTVLSVGPTRKRLLLLLLHHIHISISISISTKCHDAHCQYA